ncbi:MULTISPECIES: toprim domain-containing protein [unclassified Mycoplasma]|uniref:toprim domain-containing protein n=1 Tax=unclassified Mycoplasma TaxID=2683645 RepID=UPI00216AF05D|nr:MULTISPECIES: toprim domain-containing protein [unclassified Mycoplasma]MCS4536731.1 toprim domain-containing protein [Mycoplasma sp. CSL7475-4]MCT4469733.1 toprim domain-containing protein [Mycoplasma sp. HS2188]
MKIKTIEKANEILKKIPGISKKQAEKFTYFVLNQNFEFAQELAQNILDIKTKIEFCSDCNFIREDGKCLNCDEPIKNKTLMIVESVTTLNKIDDMGIFLGYYFVLPYLMSAKGQTKKENEYSYTQLFDYIEKHNFDEVIIVISPSLEGEITTTHLLKLLANKQIKVSRAAIGMPMGSNLEYLDTFTIKQAIKNRN